MPQTIFAVAAILSFSFFSLSQHQAQTDMAATSIGSEIELAATDVARDVLTRISGYLYDEAEIGRTGLRTDVVGLSPTMGPDAGESDASDYDDLDDFDAYQDTLSVSWHGEVVTFVATADVRYVNPDQPNLGASTPSLAKEITVTIAEEALAPQNRARVVMRLTQVVTPVWSTIHG